jgi:hypothetical protein
MPVILNSKRTDERGGDLILWAGPGFQTKDAPELPKGSIVLQTSKTVWLQVAPNGDVSVLGKEVATKQSWIVNALCDFLSRSTPSGVSISNGINLYPGVGPKGFGDVILRTGHGKFVDTLVMQADGTVVLKGEKAKDTSKAIYEGLCSWLQGIGYKPASA